jgi:hypothetical protein
MKKKPHVYQWDDEPADERPSEFASTSFTAASGYHSSMHGRHRTRPSSRVGAKTWIGVAVVLFGLGVWAVQSFAHLLRH